MNLNDFEKFVDSKILQRGKRYFKDGNINENSERNEGSWVALVQGSGYYDYTIEIDLDYANNITNCYCDCPYDWGDICKHAVAVLFDIRQIKEDTIIDISNTKVEKEATKYAKEVLFSMDENQLRLFLIEAIAENPNLKNKLVKIYKQDKGIFTKPEIKAQIDEIFKKAQFDYYGFVSAVKLRKVEDKLNILILTANKFIDAKKLDSALDITETLLENCVPRHKNYTDKRASLEPIIFKAINIFERIFREFSEVKIEDRIRLFITRSNRLFDYKLFYEKIAEILLYLSNNEMEKTKFVSWIENFRIYANAKQVNYFKNQNAIFKFQIIKKVEGAYKAYAYAKRNKSEIPQLLNFIIEENIEQKNYDDALFDTFIGVQNAFGSYKKIFEKQEKKLLKLLEKEAKIITNASLKALKITRHKRFFDLLKQNTPKAEWQKTLVEIFELLDKAKVGVKNLQTHIYIEEKMYYKLFDIVEEANDPKLALLKYDKYLVKSDVEHTGILYSVIISDIMENPNRESYIEIASLMKRMKKLQLQETIDIILEDFKTNHKRRRALWQELKDAEIIS